MSASSPSPDLSQAVLAAPAALPARLRLRHTLLAINVLAVAVVLGLWWAATALEWIAPIFLPSPGDVLHAARLVLMRGELLTDVAVSARRVFLGFALAALVAVPLGIGEMQKVAIVFMGSWIYILLYTYESTRRVDPVLLRAARNLGAGDLAVMREVILPGALPGIIAGLKVTLAISWSCVLTAEMIAAQNGLGALIWQAKDWGNLPLVLVGMLCISLTVLVADWLALRLEWLLLPWERGRVA